MKDFSIHSQSMRRPKWFNYLKGIGRVYGVNYEGTLRDDFVPKMIKLVGKTPMLKVHNVGTFYSQEYLNDWIFIAKNLPYTTFWFFIDEQCSHLDFTNDLDNVVVIAKQRYKDLIYTDSYEVRDCQHVLTCDNCRNCAGE